MIYDGDDEIVRSICTKLEQDLKYTMIKKNIPSIARIFYLDNKVIISGIPFSLDVDLTKQEKEWFRDTGHINILTNKRVFKDKLGYGYYIEGNTDDVYRRFPTKEQANRELYEHYREGGDKE